ncbi:MAG: hypothetical protein RR588_12555 [Solibacillus sp.]
MNTNTFIWLGTSPDNMVLQIPMPTTDNALFESVRLVDAARNADGVVVGQQIGRTVDKQSMGWSVIKPELWWEINRFVENNGMFFWCKYFNHNLGMWQTKRFYCGDPSCTPFMVDNDTGIPKYYKDAKFNVIAVGDA